VYIWLIPEERVECTPEINVNTSSTLSAGACFNNKGETTCTFPGVWVIGRSLREPVTTTSGKFKVVSTPSGWVCATDIIEQKHNKKIET
jgi:hypothetical protein